MINGRIRKLPPNPAPSPYALAFAPALTSVPMVTLSNDVTVRIGPRQRFRNYAPVPAVAVTIATMAPNTQAQNLTQRLSSSYGKKTRMALRLPTQTGKY